MATLIQENGIKELSKGTHGVGSNHSLAHGTHGVAAHSMAHGPHGVAPHSMAHGPHGVAPHSMAHTVATHSLAPNTAHSSQSLPTHMVPDHEYCEGAAPPAPTAAPPDEVEEDTPEIDIMINNVVCSFSVKCHLNLRQIALSGVNVEFRRENGMVTMKLRRPYTTASIWSSGRVTCTGATSEDQAKVAARRYARALQKLGFEVRFQNFRVVNVLGTCRMPFGIRIIAFSNKYKEADYEPELHPGVTYKLFNPKATLKIFSTGGVTITARSVNDVQSAVERIFPLVYEFRKARSAADEVLLRQKRARNARPPPGGAPPPRREPMQLVTLSDDERDKWE